MSGASMRFLPVTRLLLVWVLCALAGSASAQAWPTVTTSEAAPEPPAEPAPASEAVEAHTSPNPDAAAASPAPSDTPHAPTGDTVVAPPAIEAELPLNGAAGSFENIESSAATESVPIDGGAPTSASLPTGPPEGAAADASAPDEATGNDAAKATVATMNGASETALVANPADTAPATTGVADAEGEASDAASAADATDIEPARGSAADMTGIEQAPAGAADETGIEAAHSSAIDTMVAEPTSDSAGDAPDSGSDTKRAGRPSTDAAVDGDAAAPTASATPEGTTDTESAALQPDAESDPAAAAEAALDAAADAPSAFWLIGTSRESRTDSDAATVSDDPLAARPADAPDLVGPPVPDPEANEFGVSPMTILETPVPPGSRTRLSWTTGQSFSGTVMETPVIVVHGIKPGPRLCLIAGIHGDELNSVEVVRRLAYKIEPEQLAGTVIAVPIVNLLGFSRGSRYLPDRRDLNRFFPGSPYGSSASRIAHSFFRSVVHHCDALVDFHTGSFDRSNLPQVRGDLTIPSVVEFTRGFGATAVLHSPGSVGMLRQAATAQGIPSVTFEIGAPLRLQPEEIEHGEQAIETLMHKMGMVQARRRWAEPQAVFYESTWIRVDQGGMLFSDVELGDRVDAGQRLGRVIDPVSNRAAEVIADEAGRVIGMALNQLVLPGFAAYHIGVDAGEDRVVNEAERQAAPDDERFMEYDQLDSDNLPGSDFNEPESGQDLPRGRAPVEDGGDG